MTPSASEAGLADSEQKQAQMVEGWKAFKRVFQEGVALFNKKPKKGIAYLQARPGGAGRGGAGRAGAGQGGGCRPGA